VERAGRWSPTVDELEALLDEIESALEAGDIDAAVRLARRARKQFPEEPDAHLALGDALAENGDPRGSCEAYANAARLASDDADILSALGWAQFALADFEAARATAERALRLESTAAAEALLGRLMERGGDLAAADAHLRRANRTDREAWPMPHRMPEPEFRAAVAQALDRLPEDFRRALDGEVAVLVEPVPSIEVLRSEDPPWDPEILGLYVGVPLPERLATAAPPKLPDVVYLFQHNLEHVAADRDELLDEIAVTLYHEVGHYLGYDDDELEERGFA
jgi:predicted Zn-dependent protease with MMP-like domain